MTGKRLPSVKISDIDMDKCYFSPGCALSVFSPESEHKILDMLNTYFGNVKMHNLCCHHDPKLPAGSTIINNCAGCDRRFRSIYEGIQTITMWEVLDSIENLPLPDYTGLTVSVHDSCSYRPKPQVHNAVRSLLRKMNIEINESEFSGTNSICCGDNFYPRIPTEEVIAFQKRRAAQMPSQDVAVYCISCIQSMAIGGKTPHHMVDLILDQETKPQGTTIDVFHDSINEYISKH